MKCDDCDQPIQRFGRVCEALIGAIERINIPEGAIFLCAVVILGLALRIPSYLHNSTGLVSTCYIQSDPQDEAHQAHLVGLVNWHPDRLLGAWQTNADAIKEARALGCPLDTELAGKR